MTTSRYYRIPTSLLVAAAFLTGMSVQQMAHPQWQAMANLTMAVGLVLLSGLVGVRQQRLDQTRAEREARVERLESRIDKIVSTATREDTLHSHRTVPDPTRQFVTVVRGASTRSRRGPWVS